MSTKQNTLWTVVLAIASLFTGCIYERDEPSLRPEGNSLVVRFTLPAGEARTRSVPAEPGENNINDLTLLFFDYTTNGTGALVAFHRVAREDIPVEENMYGDLNNLFDLEVIFQNASGLTLTNAYSILVFANLGNGNYFNNIYDETEFNQFIVNISQMNQNEVRRTMIMEVTGVGGTVEAQDDDSKILERTQLPMSASATKEANSAHVDCQLIRTVVRYDVINKAANYTLVSASIWNAFPRGNVFDYTDVDYSYNRLKRYYGLKGTPALGDVHGGLYSFENVNTNPTQKDEKTTCLILGLINDNLPAEGVSYYRVNISPKVTGQYLTRNNVYQVTISGVNGKGAPNEPDAYNSDKVLIDTSINSWDRDEDGLIVRDETHMMAIPTKRAYFGPEAEERRYFIYTMGEGMLTMSTLSMPEGIQARLVGNDLYVTVSSFSGDKRTGAVRLNFAGLTAVMEIIQSGQASKTLKLSHTQVGSWPAAPQWIDRMRENPVQVESSGPWTAEIYNGNFSFASGSSQTLLNGVNGDRIENVYNTSVNAEVMRHSFILVTLDDDPENYRNVIVLTQLGSGSFTISPNTPLNFHADGTLSSATNTYTVYPGDPDDTWTAEISGRNADAFAITFNGTIENELVKGQGTFTITALGENFEGAFEATATVIHNNTNRQTIPISQGSYQFSLSHTTLNMGSGGGETVPVTVICNQPTATWSATIESNMPSSVNMQPFIVNSNGEKVTTLSNQPVGTTFKVWMPPVLSKLDQAAVATVKVTMDNHSGVEDELVVTQSEHTFVNIYAQTIVNHLGDWSRPQNLEAFYVFGQWAKEMTNGANFGPAGVVYTPADVNISRQNSGSITGSPTPRVINMNGVYASYGANINFGNLRGDANTIFVVSAWAEICTSFKLLGLDLQYSIKMNNQRNRNVPRVIYQAGHGNDYTDTELWDYIFNTGPFGPVDIDKVVLYPQYYPLAMTYLDRWPDTFIPLIMAPTSDTDPTPHPGRALVGIDPTHKIIWIGHKDLFGLDNNNFSNYRNWTPVADKEDNIRFLQNIIAWMINVNNYGDAFNNRFKVPK